MCICVRVCRVCAYKQPTACSMKMFSLHSISLHYIRAIRLNHNEQFFEYFFIILTFLFLLFLLIPSYYIIFLLLFFILFFFSFAFCFQSCFYFFASCSTLISIYKSEVRKEWEKKKLQDHDFAPRSKRFLNKRLSRDLFINMYKYLYDSFLLLSLNRSIQI